MPSAYIKTACNVRDITHTKISLTSVDILISVKSNIYNTAVISAKYFFFGNVLISMMDMTKAITIISIVIVFIIATHTIVANSIRTLLYFYTRVNPSYLNI